MLMVALTMSLSSFAVDWLSPPDACIDGIAYHLDRVTKEASVTYNGEQPLNSPDATGGYTGVITIPSSITHEGVTYKVTTIGKKAFAGCRSLKKIVIKKPIKKIGKKAFFNCKKLKTIKIYTKKLTANNVGKDAFKNISKTAVFYVPKRKKTVYKTIFIKRGATKRMVFKTN